MRILIGLVAAFMTFCAPASGDSITMDGVVFDYDDERRRPSTPEQKAFAADYFAAVAAKDMAKLEALVHPASRACATNDARRGFQKQSLDRHLKYSIPATVTKVMFVPIDDVPLGLRGPEAMVSLPARPVVVFGVSYSYRDAQGVRVNEGNVLRPLARHEGRLVFVEHCLTPKGEELYVQRDGKPVTVKVPLTAPPPLTPSPKAE